MAQLLTNQTTNTTQSETHNGGMVTVFANGTFDGARVRVLVNKYGRDVPAYKDLDFTQDGHATFPMGACTLKIELSNAGSSTSINAGFESF